MTYWRTQKGEFEVDCILGDELAIEIKSSEKFDPKMLTGLKALKGEKKTRSFALVSKDKVERQVECIKVIHYEKFLKQLWSGSLLS